MGIAKDQREGRPSFDGRPMKLLADDLVRVDLESFEGFASDDWNARVRLEPEQVEVAFTCSQVFMWRMILPFGINFL